MSNLPEIIGASVLLLLLLLYFINSRPKYKENKKALLAKYRRIRVKSLNVQDALTQYIIEHDALKKEYEEGVTYSVFLNQLKKNHINNLSEKHFLKLKASNNRILLNKTDKMLDEQEAKLDAIEKQFEASKK
ncbi:hypothetical protein HYN59_00025 [Flavobacterium album]|uniref:Uncharacterized protein n=1 Tax=Flavobacterium album TaxID=2175091 RepID=A0A2S1QT45_9FLAO|nr:hypothetical protein [Flavobacterium album]AWH83597.1 hypothetical protein HYN59_00025 [Flavobacterium album]